MRWPNLWGVMVCLLFLSYSVVACEEFGYMIADNGNVLSCVDGEWMNGGSVIGDVIEHRCEYFDVSAWPHTQEFWQPQYINYSNNRNVSEVIDLCLYSKNPLRGSVFRWANLTRDGSPVMGWQNFTEFCEGEQGVNYGFINATHGYCNKTYQMGNDSGIFVSAGDVYQVDNFQVVDDGVWFQWQEWSIIGFEQEYYMGWRDVTSALETFQFANHYLACARNMSYNPLENKQFKIVPKPWKMGYNNNLKYGLFAKRSNDTLGDALIKDHYCFVDPWVYSDFFFRLPINVTNGGGSLINNQQVRLEINTSDLILNGKMNTDCSDIRFTNSTDDEIYFYVDEFERPCNDARGTWIWVKVPRLPGYWNNETLYMYFGNFHANSLSNGAGVFLFFDDFPGTEVNSSHWDIVGSSLDLIEIDANGDLHIQENGASLSSLETNSTIGFAINDKVNHFFGYTTTGNSVQFDNWGGNIGAYYSNKAARWQTHDGLLGTIGNPNGIDYTIPANFETVCINPGGIVTIFFYNHTLNDTLGACDTTIVPLTVGAKGGKEVWAKRVYVRKWNPYYDDKGGFSYVNYSFVEGSRTCVRVHSAGDEFYDIKACDLNSSNEWDCTVYQPYDPICINPNQDLLLEIVPEDFNLTSARGNWAFNSFYKFSFWFTVIGLFVTMGILWLIGWMFIRSLKIRF